MTNIKYLISAILLICLAFVQAQERTKDDIYKVTLPRHDFIDLNKNMIQVPGKDSTLLNNFFQKIDSLLATGKGQINILHIGASHVQADMFSHRLRLNLDIINGANQTSRGLIFPYSVARTNNPSNYRVTHSGTWSSARNVQKNRTIPLGMSGITVFTKDASAQISFNLNPQNGTEETRWTFDRLRMLAHTENENHCVTPILHYADGQVVGQVDYENRVYTFDLPRACDSFRLTFTQNCAIRLHNFYIGGLILENQSPGIVYHAIGVNGASVTSYLECENFERELKLLNPDLVIFGIGINDAAAGSFTADSFYYNYNLLIDKFKRVNADCAYIFITNNDSFRRISRNNYRVNPNGLIARDVFFRLATEHQAGVWDLFTIMGGLSSMQRWQTARLAQVDRLHFTLGGYQLLGDMLYNAIVDYYKTK